MSYSEILSGAAATYGLADSIFGFNRKRNKKDSKEMMNYSAQLGEEAAQRDYRRSVGIMNSNFHLNKRLAEQGFGFNQQLMEMGQNYNSAESQVQRLKDAGLSVGLMMGGGGAGASTSASTGSGSVSGGSPSPSSRPGAPGLSEKLYGGLQLESMKTAIEGMKLSNEEKKVEIQEKVAKADIAKTEEETKVTAEKAKQELVNTKVSKKYALDTARESFEKLITSRQLDEHQAEEIRKELEYIDRKSEADINERNARAAKWMSDKEAVDIHNKWLKAIDSYGLNKEFIQLIPYMTQPMLNILLKGKGGTTINKSFNKTTNNTKNINVGP